MPTQFDPDWDKTVRVVDDLSNTLRKHIDTALKQEAEYLVKQVKLKLRTGPFKPLAGGKRKTSPGKGGSKPLMASAAMFNSVQKVAVDGGGFVGFFIGIPRGAAGHNGRVYSLAAIHENGATISVKRTTKMMRYLFAVVFAGEERTAPARGKGEKAPAVITITIPARPFVGPTFEAEAPLVPDRLMARIAAAAGVLGSP